MAMSPTKIKKLRRKYSWVDDVTFERIADETYYDAVEDFIFIKHKDLIFGLVYDASDNSIFLYTNETGMWISKVTFLECLQKFTNNTKNKTYFWSDDFDNEMTYKIINNKIFLEEFDVYIDDMSFVKLLIYYLEKCN